MQSVSHVDILTLYLQMSYKSAAYANVNDVYGLVIKNKLLTIT